MGRTVPLFGRCRDLFAAERRHYRFREPVQVFQRHGERGAEGHAAHHAIDAGIALLHRLQPLDDVIRRAGQEAAGLRGPRCAGSLAVAASLGRASLRSARRSARVPAATRRASSYSPRSISSPPACRPLDSWAARSPDGWGKSEITPRRFVVVVVEITASVRAKISVSAAHGRFLREI